jgi:hypothetical protein
MVMSPLRLSSLTDCTTNYTFVLSSERAPQDEEQSNCSAKERKKKNLAMGPKGVPDTKTDRQTDRRSQHQLNSIKPPQHVPHTIMFFTGLLCLLTMANNGKNILFLPN